MNIQCIFFETALRNFDHMFKLYIQGKIHWIYCFFCFLTWVTSFFHWVLIFFDITLNTNFFANNVCKKSNTTDDTCGAGTAYSRSIWVHLRFLVGSCCSIVSFLCSVFSIMVCSFVLFLLDILVSVLLWFTASNYVFGSFKLVLPKLKSLTNYGLRDIIFLYLLSKHFNNISVYEI